MHLVARGDSLRRKGSREEAGQAGAMMWSQLESAFPLIPRGALQRGGVQSWTRFETRTPEPAWCPCVSWVQVVFAGGRAGEE